MVGSNTMHEESCFNSGPYNFRSYKSSSIGRNGNDIIPPNSVGETTTLK